MVTENQVRKVARDCSLVFNALGDPNRQDILIMLETEGPLNVLQITERLNLARPTISHHLKILSNANPYSAASYRPDSQWCRHRPEKLQSVAKRCCASRNIAGRLARIRKACLQTAAFLCETSVRSGAARGLEPAEH